MLGGKVINNLKKLPINNINIPNCNKPLINKIITCFLMFVKSKQNKVPNINNKIKFITIILIK